MKKTLDKYEVRGVISAVLPALIYNQVQTLQEYDGSADYIDMTRSKEDIDKILNKARKGKLNFLCGGFAMPNDEILTVK